MQNNDTFYTCQVHGIPVNISSLNQALSEVDILIHSRQHHYVCFFEGNLFSRALRSNDVKNAIIGASLIYPDGITIAREMKWILKQNVARVSGPSFLLRACEYGIKHDWKHFFLGGEEGIAQKLSNDLRVKYPGIKIVGCYTPPFRELTISEETELKKQIEESNADLLWVGLGGPKQEFWMKKHLNVIDIPVMLGVGAAFDFHSGNRPWAPSLIRKSGFEWLYRMLFGGKRTFFRNIKCTTHLSGVLIADRINSMFQHAEEKELRVPGLINSTNR